MATSQDQTRALVSVMRTACASCQLPSSTMLPYTCTACCPVIAHALRTRCAFRHVQPSW